MSRAGRHITGWACAILLACAVAGRADAAEAPPLAADPALEARMMAIADELRCLVCQNETLAASQADLAKDLRQQIRTQLQRGRSQTQILAYMTERYGDFILYRPPWKATTLALWLGPFLLLAVGAMAIWWQARSPAAAAAAAGAVAMADVDRQRARHLLVGSGVGSGAGSEVEVTASRGDPARRNALPRRGDGTA